MSSLEKAVASDMFSILFKGISAGLSRSGDV